tara:strand:+ start:324 stop:728 length:405 start_codon:yes stop_codon:yes gene_type:complete
MVRITKTETNRKRDVVVVKIPMNTKRGFRVSVFQSDTAISLQSLMKKLGPIRKDDYVLRKYEDASIPQDYDTLRRYWIDINKKLGLSYKLYSARSHKITEMVLAKIPLNLISRNVGTSVKQIESSYLRYAPEQR